MEYLMEASEITLWKMYFLTSVVSYLVVSHKFDIYFCLLHLHEVFALAGIILVYFCIVLVLFLISYQFIRTVFVNEHFIIVCVPGAITIYF